MSTSSTVANASRPSSSLEAAGGEAGAARKFPPAFLWGASTSSYQIEGAVAADGRGESIWDRFCATPGRIADGSSGAVACDHYHRWSEDIALIGSLGLGAYRFSIAWPRVIPDGGGPGSDGVNGAGLDFYDRLVDGLLAAGITPLPTLYHWDLPQPLEDRGGWAVRATAEAFARYSRIVVERLADRVPRWMTINEPFVVADHGYRTGEHAPGRRDLAAAVATSHHVLVAHGLALEHIRELAPRAEAGIALNFTPVVATGESDADLAEARRVDDWENNWYLEPLAGRGYPAETAGDFGWAQDEVLDGDRELIAQPIDVLGVNFYTRQFVRAGDEPIDKPGPTTAMGWEIHPPTFGELLRRIHDRYRFPRYLVTENGAAMADTEREGGRHDGHVVDADRIAYLAGHLAEVHDAIAAGMPIDGYFVWSLLDNFEWAHGYRPRFGIVEIAEGSLERIPKQSARWYGDLARTGVLTMH